MKSVRKAYLEDFTIGAFAQSSNSFEFVDPHISVSRPALIHAAHDTFVVATLVSVHWSVAFRKASVTSSFGPLTLTAYFDTTIVGLIVRYQRMGRENS